MTSVLTDRGVIRLCSSLLVRVYFMRYYAPFMHLLSVVLASVNVPHALLQDIEVIVLPRVDRLHLSLRILESSVSVNVG